MDVHRAISGAFRLYEELGQSQYLGEEVSKTEHSIQCAMLAEQDGASEMASYPA